MSEPFGLHSIGQILIPVTDLDRAVDFYRDKLGMRFLFQVPGMAFFDCSGIRLLLGVPEAGQRTGPVTIYYRVEDIGRATAILGARDVRIGTHPHVVHRTESYELWMSSVSDPDDNPVVLMAERPAHGAAPGAPPGGPGTSGAGPGAGGGPARGADTATGTSG